MAQKPSASISIAIVEDSNEFRTCLTLLLQTAPDFRCVGGFASGREARKRIPVLRPQVVLMDIMLSDGSGVDLVRELKPRLPGTHFIMLTVTSASETLFAALMAGATGYLLKDTTSQEEILNAIREARTGGSPMSPTMARLVVNSFRDRPPTGEPLPSLTAREHEVLEHLSKGLLYKEISDKLGITYETVHSHIRVIYEKLQVRSRTQAVMRYVQGNGPRLGM